MSVSVCGVHFSLDAFANPSSCRANGLHLLNLTRDCSSRLLLFSSLQLSSSSITSIGLIQNKHSPMSNPLSNKPPFHCRGMYLKKCPSKMSGNVPDAQLRKTVALKPLTEVACSIIYPYLVRYQCCLIICIDLF